MTGEEMQRAVQFILEQQAQLTATVGRLSETVDRLANKVDRTADSVNALLTIAEIHEHEISDLREAGRLTDERLSEMGRLTDERISALTEAGRATDERLSALINVVEKYISERRNGQA